MAAYNKQLSAGNYCAQVVQITSVSISKLDEDLNVCRKEPFYDANGFKKIRV